MVTGVAFVVSRTSVPEITSVWQVCQVLAIYLAFLLLRQTLNFFALHVRSILDSLNFFLGRVFEERRLGSWFIFSVKLGNMLFNGKAPRSNATWPDWTGSSFNYSQVPFRVFVLYIYICIL